MADHKPEIVINYCTQCQWLLRAAWLAQELLSTFADDLGRVALEEADAWWMQVAVNLLGTAALMGLAMLTAWYGMEKRDSRRSRPLSAAPQPDRG